MQSCAHLGKYKVKMGGYWPHSFLCVYRPGSSKDMHTAGQLSWNLAEGEFK